MCHPLKRKCEDARKHSNEYGKQLNACQTHASTHANLYLMFIMRKFVFDVDYDKS